MFNSISRFFLLGYFGCALIGWFLLQLPLSQNQPISAIDLLFTAASAVSTTGLATVDLGQTLSFFGQCTLALLIQLGGIGYMVFSSFILLSLKREILDVKELIKQVLLYTLVCELCGTLALYFSFTACGVEKPLWQALFHTISAFCTAGFSLFSSNLEGYRSNLGINCAVSLLSLLGAFGFFLVLNIWKKKSFSGVVNRLMRTFTAFAILLGISVFVIGDDISRAASLPNKLMIATFHVVSAITTAGFNTIEMGTLPHTLHFLLVLLMILGVTLTGNGRDLRGVTFFSWLKLLGDRTRHKRWSQKVFWQKTGITLSTFGIYCVSLFFSVLLLSLLESHSLHVLLFESASALCTIGLSTGITPHLSTLGKSLLIFLMLFGRIGILLYSFALSRKALLRFESRELT